MSFDDKGDINVWINAIPNDQVALSGNGIVNSAGVALTSTANVPNETDVGPVVTVYLGELAGLVQGAVTGSGKAYLQSFSCTVNNNPITLDGSNLSISQTGVAFVCTFVNEYLPPAPPPPKQELAIPVTSPEGLALMAALLALLGAAATRGRGRN